MAANSPDSPVTPTDSNSATLAIRVRNLLIVLVAVILSVAIFLGLRTPVAASSLTVQAEASVPLEIAVSNGKPTLMEFYANWCTSCQAMAKDLGELKQQYGDRINFVMLNVDNSKWLPEVLQYRVDGIPHFVYLDHQGKAIANAIGEQPGTVIAANLEALMAETSLPYAQSTGQVSNFSAPVTPKAGVDDPRSHGSQVVN